MDEEIYIKVSETEKDEEPIEFLIEPDNTIPLSSIAAQFPEACGLKYRFSVTNTLRGLKLTDGVVHMPTNVEDWKNQLYIVTKAKLPQQDVKASQDNKRKLEEDSEMEEVVNSKRPTQGHKTTDLVVLGLPWKVDERGLKDHFNRYGELAVCMIKRDGNGKSRGFGFIRYEKYENQQKVLREKNHVVEGRNCEVKIPHQKEESPKIFVSRITESMTKEDLSDHFSKFGDVKDVYIPRPFRSFAFVQFYDASVAQSLVGEEQVCKGVSISINSATPKQSSNNQSGGGRNIPSNNFMGRQGGNSPFGNSHNNGSYTQGLLSGGGDPLVTSQSTSLVQMMADPQFLAAVGSAMLQQNSSQINRSHPRLSGQDMDRRSRLHGNNGGSYHGNHHRGGSRSHQQDPYNSQDNYRSPRSNGSGKYY